jgi:ferritin-like metal-binding protein YciE
MPDMAEVKTTEGLLINALQDLHDAERAMAEKLPGIADDVSDLILRELLDEDAMRSTVHQRKVADLLKRRGAGVDGDPNIWLRAILDDAVRDTETVERGALLDIALIGAIRKAKQAERVSYETAIALAEALDGDDAPTLAAIRDEEAASDLRLTSILAELTDGNKMETA